LKKGEKQKKENEKAGRPKPHKTSAWIIYLFVSKVIDINAI